MTQLKALFEAVSARLKSLAQRNAVVAKPISIGNRHVVTLCELSLGFGGFGASGEGQDDEHGGGKGTGGGAGGRAMSCPVAVIVIDGGKVRVEELGK